MMLVLARAGAVVALLVAGCGSGQSQPLDMVSFATNWVAQAEHGGFYQAVADGTYKKHGLDVTIMPGGPNVNHRLQLIAGRVEFYMSANTLQAFDAVAQKIPTLLDAIRASKLKASRSLRGHFSPDYTGVKRLRPTRRRFAKVALPLLLELRFRKPCCRLRRILDG